MNIFRSADILLPDKNALSERWSVVACDQYTSRPDYWKQAEEIAGDAPSTLNLIYPEAYLDQGSARIESINRTMTDYLERGIFRTLPDQMILVERKLNSGRVRTGLIGAIDLEAYDYNFGAKAPIRATEKTVLERIPPRVEIRKNAPIELPHVILLIDDADCTLIEPIRKGELLYDIDLMLGGNNLKGYAVPKEEASRFSARFEQFAASARDGLVLAVGDGNHSLASAKACWEAIKPTLSDAERETHPARFCLAEVENIHDPSQEFEPIHRAVFGVDPHELIAAFSALEQVNDSGDGQPVTFVTANGDTTLFCRNTPLAVGLVQRFLDERGEKIDYIHGEEEIRRLAARPDTVGILLPKPGKSELFETVIADGALPRKTFSMGEANEKRYYMEAKKIRP